MKPLEKWMKKENLGVLLLVGLLLLVIALPARQENENTITEENTQETDQSLQEQDWQTKMEERLVEVLEQVQGVGKAEVFLTCEAPRKRLWKRMRQRPSMSGIQRKSDPLCICGNLSPGHRSSGSGSGRR